MSNEEENIALAKIAKPTNKAKKAAEKLGVDFSKLAGKKAKHDHVILQNDFQANIKKGDFLDDIPERFYETLKTEKVI